MLKNTYTLLLLMMSTLVCTTVQSHIVATRKRGRLEVITGPMFSGKTTKLMKLLEFADRANKRVFTIKKDTDNRLKKDSINTHNGSLRKALPAYDAVTIREHLPADFSKIDVVGIEEGQFFTHDIVDLVNELVDAGVRVIVSGLDVDCFRTPFGPMPALMAHADSVTKLTSVCSKCGADARFHQINVPESCLPEDTNSSFITGVETCDARCRDCKQWPQGGEAMMELTAI